MLFSFRYGEVFVKRKILWISLVSAVLLFLGSVFGVNAYVKHSVKERIVSYEDACELSDIDCVLILGCLVKTDGSPSDMLEDRLEVGIRLYQSKAAPKLLMSGDHGREDYNEVGAMKRYAVESGVPSYDVFMDHAGFSTYESLYRLKEIFRTDKVLIVTQEYHLYRALYIAKELGIDAYGISADLRSYSGQGMRDVREVLARYKDFFATFFKPYPTYLGDAVPIFGNGDFTNDEDETYK